MDEEGIAAIRALIKAAIATHVVNGVIASGRYDNQSQAVLQATDVAEMVMQRCGVMEALKTLSESAS